MKKIKAEFLTERDANIVLDKIKSYCGNIKINYNNYYYPGYIPDEYDFNYPSMAGVNFFNFNGFGIIPNLNISQYNLENKYINNFYQSERTIIEAEIADDNYGYVREKLYSCGAMIVV